MSECRKLCTVWSFLKTDPIDRDEPLTYDDVMPTVMRLGPYRLFFYSGDGEEPPHVHVDRDDAEAKFWLDPIRLERSRGFRRHELVDIEHLIVDNQQALLEGWNEYFNG